MKLLIISDNDSNQMYSSIETGSIGFYPSVSLDRIDFEIVSNNIENTNILALITNENGLGKLLFATLKKIEKNEDKYDLTYIALNVIDNEDEISNFNRAFPYAFKDENSAKVSGSKELIKIAKFFTDKENTRERIASTDMKSVIMNSDVYRLQGSKSEVFKKGYEDGVHSRLSHSIRVRHIAEMISCKLSERVDVTIDYSLIENISMAMNIGHTPHGKVGENVINGILHGKDDIIPNVDMIGFKYYRHNMQSARMLERVESMASRDNCIGLDVIAGIIGHSKFNFDKPIYDNVEKVNEYLSKYFINYDNLIGEWAILKGNQLIPKSLEGQIVSVADEIAQKSYDLELAIRGNVVDRNEIVTRLKLLSEVTGEFFEFNYTTLNERYYTSRKISSDIVSYLVGCACDSFKFDLYKSGEEDCYIDFSEPGIIVLEMIDNYFQSKLLLSRKVRLYDHKSKQVIHDIFKEIYNDINLLPSFHKDRIIDEFQKEGFKDINILLCFISFRDGKEYLDEILYSDVKKVKNKGVQEVLIRKREIIIQAIIDYIVCLSDNDAELLHDSLVHN